MSISDDEVEAAAKALYEDDDLWSASERPWPAKDAAVYRRLAHAALTAAAKVRANSEGDGPTAGRNYDDIDDPRKTGLAPLMTDAAEVGQDCSCGRYNDERCPELSCPRDEMIASHALASIPATGGEKV